MTNKIRRLCVLVFNSWKKSHYRGTQGRLENKIWRWWDTFCVFWKRGFGKTASCGVRWILLGLGDIQASYIDGYSYTERDFGVFQLLTWPRVLKWGETVSFVAMIVTGCFPVRMVWHPLNWNLFPMVQGVFSYQCCISSFFFFFFHSCLNQHGWFCELSTPCILVVFFHST